MKFRKVALIGNPNTGKTSLFNHLTGLNQQVGNFPGVTVEKKTGRLSAGGVRIDVIDLPGTYSIFPRSKDERVVFDLLLNPEHSDHPDVMVVNLDASNLERNLLLATQLHDLGLPLILVLTMPDVAASKGISVNADELSKAFDGAAVIVVNGRTGEGIESLKKTIINFQERTRTHSFTTTDIRSISGDHEKQSADASKRFGIIRSLLHRIQSVTVRKNVREIDRNLDRILVHPVFGYLIFLALLLIIFQVIFHIASFPMDLIDGVFFELSQWVKGAMPAGVLTNLLAEGIIPGIGGVLVFVPQIALLFFCIAILEDTGYMSRVVFIMDRLVRPFGLNGKSVVPLISSAACAIPGIMATRNINNWKDRIITIMVAPLMSCSARIPVFTLLIALVIPDRMIWGFLNLQGLILFALYTLGLMSALFVAFIMQFLIRAGEKSFLVMELPTYQVPRWKQVLITSWEKVKIFVRDAGKVILAISIILWAMASYGPPGRMDEAVDEFQSHLLPGQFTAEEEEQQINAIRLENSFIGIIGKTIEPVIAPLGYDWKIGIAVITSFAAREVFVGSMATIYSVGEDFEEGDSLLQRLRDEKYPGTDRPVYTLASGLSLMVFYVFAMQCMATFAVVKRETGTWKWPVLQMIYMGVLAYICALVVYQIFK